MSRDDVELQWPGKFDANGQRAVPPRARPALVEVERHPGTADGDPGWLIRGDNLHGMDALLGVAEGKVDLIYLDPPFGTGSTFEVATRVGNDARAASTRVPAYSDHWEGGTGGFLSMLDLRLQQMHGLLAPRGSLYVHVDPTYGHAVKLVLDGVFGSGCFQREIVWRIGWVSGFKSRARNWIRNHDTILFYTKDPQRFTFNKPWVPRPEGYQRRKGKPSSAPGFPVDDVWNAGAAELALTGHDSLDSIQIKSFSSEKTGYATQKNESLLERIVAASSNPGDLVLDPFCGSGTTLVAAQRLGRRFIGMDGSRTALALTRRRLLATPNRVEVRVFELGDHERRLQAAGADGVDLVLRHVGAERLEGGPIHGVRGNRAVHVVAENTRPQAHRALGQLSRDRGYDGVDVHAWRWTLTPGQKWPPGVRPVQIERELLDPRWARRPSRAVQPCPRVQVKLRGLGEGTVTVDLCGYERESEEERPEMEGWSDWIDGWMVDWNWAEGGPFHAQAVAMRPPGGGKLSLRLGPHRYRGNGGVRIGLRLIDILGVETSLEIRLTRDGAGRLRRAR